MTVVLTTATAVLVTGVLSVGTHHPRGSEHKQVRPRLHVLTVRGLGDSVPAGARCGCLSYVSLLGERISLLQSTRVGVVNEAKNGETSSDLLAQVRHDHTSATASSVTLVTIGANDFDASVLSRPGCSQDDLSCYAGPLAQLGTNLDALLSALTRAPGPHGPVLVTGYWNVFLDGAVGAARGLAYERDSDALTRSVNDVIRARAVHHGLTYVDLHAPFKEAPDGDDTALLAPDGDHPSMAGHDLITQVLFTTLKADLGNT
jgi:lysophospholipase L1-like esterase